MNCIIISKQLIFTEISFENVTQAKIHNPSRGSPWSSLGRPWSS